MTLKQLRDKYATKPLALAAINSAVSHGASEERSKILKHIYRVETAMSTEDALHDVIRFIKARAARTAKIVGGLGKVPRKK